MSDLILPGLPKAMADYPVIYQLLNPTGGTVTTGHDAAGMAKFIKDQILDHFDVTDHGKFSVACYRQSAAVRGKALLEVQVSAEEFYKQAMSALA